jgi:hypothetical protein
MTLTTYHAKYFAHDLTRRAVGGMDRLSMSLFDAAVDLNPHQIEAALFALESPLSKGVVLADEVGLGKTIEAGIVLCQFWAERKRRLLVLCPASLRKQWALELEEKFNLPTRVLDAKAFRDEQRNGRAPLNEKAVPIMSFNYANALRDELKAIAWDLVVVDEAHKLRNAYRPSNKVGQGIRWATEGCRKLLLTATPLQNSLFELFGLSTLIDEHLFGDLNAFRSQYAGVGGNISEVRLWEEIALALLKKYTERYYTFRKREWELPHLEYQDLAADDPNFLGAKDEPGDGYYRILIEKSQDEIVAKLEGLKALIEKGDLKPWEFHGMKAVWFGRHLYEPLLYLDQKIVEISPLPLNKGERQLVDDLKAYHDSNASRFFSDKELYLLRNLSKGRGVGFFEAGNFHPDFILWLLIGSRQHVIFVDPKGIRNLGPTDPKIQFYAEIKKIEQRLGNPMVRLESFIVSNTPSHTMKMLWGIDKSAMMARHVLFQEEDKDTYVRVMLEGVAAAASAAS